MTFSYSEITACPHCGHLYNNWVLASSNSFGTIQYSDGYLHGTKSNHTPFKKCDNQDCKRFFNINEATKISVIDPEKSLELIPTEWKNASSYNSNPPQIEDLKEGLASDFSNDITNETNLRIELLWIYNDKLRNDRTSELPVNEKTDYTDNLTRLIQILNSPKTNNEKIFLAELYRESSDFENCITILDSIKNETEDEVFLKKKIYSQAKVKDPRVFNVQYVMIKKEYKCNSCNDSVILFDLEHTFKPAEYTHFRCLNDNKIFTTATKIKNPAKPYKINFLQKFLKLKEPYSNSISKTEINCPSCQSNKIVPFNPTTENCITCSTCRYNVVKWF